MNCRMDKFSLKHTVLTFKTETHQCFLIHMFLRKLPVNVCWGVACAFHHFAKGVEAIPNHLMGTLPVVQLWPIPFDIQCWKNTCPIKTPVEAYYQAGFQCAHPLLIQLQCLVPRLQPQFSPSPPVHSWPVRPEQMGSKENCVTTRHVSLNHPSLFLFLIPLPLFPSSHSLLSSLSGFGASNIDLSLFLEQLWAYVCVCCICLSASVCQTLIRTVGRG